MKIDIGGDYDGEFEKLGEFIIGEHTHKTHIRNGNLNDYEHYIKAKDVDNDSEDSSYTNIYELHTHEFKKVNRLDMVKAQNSKKTLLKYFAKFVFVLVLIIVL